MELSSLAFHCSKIMINSMQFQILRNIVMKIAVALPLAIALQGATYEVAQQNSQSSDAAPGTAEKPWRTIARAAEMVKPGDVVIVRAGMWIWLSLRCQYGSAWRGCIGWPF